MDYIKYITDGIEYTCKNHKRRSAGCESVKTAQADMAEAMKDCVDEIRTQQFEIHPKAFIGSIPLDALISLIACALFTAGVLTGKVWLYMVSLILTIVTATIIIVEYILFRPFTDKLYPKKTGQNLYMVRKAKNTPKRRIILCGHADAAWEMPVLKHFPTVLIYICIGSAFLYWAVNFFFCYLALAGFLPVKTLYVFTVIEIINSIMYAPLLFFVDWNTVVDGANDNLTGCYLAMSIIKEMADNDIRYDDTEVCALITDGEESGLRGARAFANEFVEEMLSLNTIVIAPDTVHSVEELRIFSRGINYTESNSEEVCNLLQFSAMKNGLDIRTAEFYPGANDSEAFSAIGVKAAAICGVAFTPQDYYHTVRDTYTNLNPDCIKLVRNILKQAIDMFTKTGKTF
ncbi:MAG: M28 family peptidase [Erysipelotrichaceae bacterium]|nr:M28 family peptidase [Erysipelotrichaceae bacterium]